MKIAMLGQKGIPAHSGGVEQHVDVLSQLLTRRGHEVVVYCRRSYCGRQSRSSSNGKLHRVIRPSIATKHLDAITHTLAGTIDVILRRADVVHYHAIGPAVLAPLARLSGLPVVVTVHGLDWQRAKWGPFAQRCLKLGEWMATVASSKLVVVSPVLRNYFAEQHKIASEFIPNGIMPMERCMPDRILEFGVEPQKYIFAASRLVPEKGFHHLIKAFQKVPHDVKLVIAGGGGFDGDYEKSLRQCDDPRVIFTGPADRELMAEFFSHALLFVLPSEIEGMPLVLLEAMNMGVPVLVSDIPENECVVEDAGVTFRSGDVDDLRMALTKMLDDEDLHENWSAKVVAKSAPYRWEDSVEQLEEVYFRCAGVEIESATLQPSKEESFGSVGTPEESAIEQTVPG